MEKDEKIIAIVFSVMAILLVIPIISAAALSATWNAAGATGLNYSNLTGSFTYNCTVSAHKATNVTVYANKTTGVMNPLQSFANTSASQTAWTGTVDIQAADDGSNQNLTCKAQNATVTAYSAEKSAIRVRLDSTSPGCNVSRLHSTVAFAGLQTITYYSSDVLARRLTTVDVNGPGKQVTITLTAQNGPVELKSNDTKYIGSWTANMTVTDWSGNSCTDSATFKTYLPDGEIDEEPQPAAGGNNILLLIIAAIVLYFIFKKK